MRITYSKYVYIELINREDSVLCRQKYKCDSACFKGELFLETDLPSGNYYLRAYARLMQNFSPTAFTLITIPVDNLSTTRYSGNIPSHVYFYPEGGHLLSGSLQNVAFEVKDENGLPVQTTASLCKGSSDTVYSNLVTDSYGIGSFSFIPEDRIIVNHGVDNSAVNQKSQPWSSKPLKIICRFIIRSGQHSYLIAIAFQHPPYDCCPKRMMVYISISCYKNKIYLLPSSFIHFSLCYR